MNLFKKFRSGFTKTRESLVGAVKTIVNGKVLGEDQLEELEETLITADLGVEISFEIVERLRIRSKKEELAGDMVVKALEEELLELVKEVPQGLEQELDVKPHVMFVIGVNGSGKTTTIGKLAKMFTGQGEKVLLVAADTFRSAAVEQLEVWAQRSNSDVVKGATGGDPAAVVFDGLNAALARGVDRVIVDTAGRLQTKVNLMMELEKLDRVAKKIIPDAPHEVILVLDGGTGQNGLSQAKQFAASSGVSGLVVTKLDGTAKGGVMVPIGRELGIPVKWIGLGEGIDDLLPFDQEMMVRSIISSKPADQEKIVESHDAETLDNE